MVRNIYRIRNSATEQKIGKVYPQIQTFCGNMSFFDKSFYEIYDNVPKSLSLNYFSLHKDSKRNDFLSASMINKGFLVSKKTKNLFETFSLGNHIFIPAIVKNFLGQDFEYYWFIFNNPIGQNLDFMKSRFIIQDSFGDTTKIKFSSYEELLQFFQNMSSLKKIKPTQLYLKETKTADIFTIFQGSSENFISKSIHDCFIEENISGIDLKKVF